MGETSFNKYRAAAAVLSRGREQLVEEITETILDQSDDLVEGGYYFHEFLENQGTRLHFIGLLMAQLEHSAESLDEERAAAAKAAAAAARQVTAAPKKRATRRPRARQNVADQAPSSGKRARQSGEDS